MQVNMINYKVKWGVVCLMVSLSAWKSEAPHPHRFGADTLAYPKSFGFGRLAKATEIAALDTDVRPDGKGLPAGSGKASEGKKVYALKCAACHGATGVEGPNDALVTRQNSNGQKEKGRNRTIGNYWPYATTIFDYIKRAMPFNQPNSLTDQEVYDLTAFLLHENGLIQANERMDAQTLPQVNMPAKAIFVPDDRRDGAEIR
jgi:cytochrome c